MFQQIVPEPDERFGIYRRLAALNSAEAADDLGDRFGELPPALVALLDLARLRIACLELATRQRPP